MVLKADGEVDVEIFRSDGKIEDESMLETLFARFSTGHGELQEDVQKSQSDQRKNVRMSRGNGRRVKL